MSTSRSVDTGFETIHALIDKMASTRPEATFLISPETGRVLTFRDFQQQSGILASQLQQLGLRPGDKVAFLMDNGLFTVQLFFGAMYGGFVSVPLNVRAGVSQLSYMLNHCDAKVVFVEDQYARLMDEVMATVSRAVQVIRADIDSISTTCQTPPLPTLPTIPAPEDVALLTYTSGSTGQPKAAVHSHRTLLAHGRNIVCSHQLSAEDRSLLVLPLYHINAECVTLTPTLLSGGSVVVAHRFSLSHFWDWLDEHRCTWSALVPTIIAELLDWEDPRSDTRQAAFERIRFLRTSSAPISPSLHREFVDKFHLLLIQGMGSSEGGNVFSNPLPPGENKIGSTGLVWGFETKIINREGVEVPPGEPGEVLIRGAALARGYYKEPEATAAVFDHDGWLHTGDLAYQDSDGYFFVVGRSKELIIKAGVNIAPRQIDEVLESHPAVREAAAVGVPDHHVGEDLVAFVVLRTGIATDESELLAFCESQLGHFKTPTRIHFIEDLPKGPSGKVQRLRLLDEATRPRISQVPDTGVSPLPSSIEQTIADIWAKLLKVPQVNLNDNFFTLGGDSLLAIQTLSQLRDKLPLRLTLSEFFENSTIGQLAAHVRKRLSPGAGVGDPSTTDQLAASKNTQQQPLAALDLSATIPPRNRALPYRLSPGQERLWFLEKLHPRWLVYNESEAVRLHGELNVDAMEQALNAIVARHEALRTTIQEKDGQPMGVVHENWLLHLKKIDLSALTAQEREAEVERLLIAEPSIPYSLQIEPAIRATLIRLGPVEHIFILMMHHIICDWSSEGVVWRELAILYRSFSCGQPVALPPLPIQDGDHAIWQRQQLTEASLTEDLAFWVENLSGAPALLELPSDRPRPPVMSHSGTRKRFRLDRTLTEALRRFNRKAKTSLFAVCAAALKTLLYRYTGSEDILVGIPIADRHRPELQSVIGFLLQTHVLRTALSGDMTFRELVARVQQGALKVFEHRSVPFDQVVRAVRPERNLSYAPLFQVVFNWRDREQALSFIGLEGLEVESLLSETRTSKFDLELILTDMGDEVWAEMNYSTDLFDELGIVRMFGHYRTLLEAVAADPDRRLYELPMLTDAEQLQLADWNDTVIEHPNKDRCLHQLIEEQVRRTPEQIAAVFERQQLTYRQLDEKANQLANYLRKRGAGKNVLVGVCMERSLDMVVSLLAVLKSGAACLPLDPTYPRERLALIIADAKPLVVLTQENLKDAFSEAVRRICLDSDSEGISNENKNRCENEASVDDIAYVIYTSGSTGQPRGVLLTHYNVVRLFQSTWDWYKFDPHDVWAMFHSCALDFSVWELWGGLVYGGRVVIVPYLVSRSPEEFYELLYEEHVTVLHQTPSSFRQLIETEERCGKQKLSLRLVILGGEALEMQSLAPWFEHHGDKTPQIVNTYGNTETTVQATHRPLTAADVQQRSVIGRPLPDLSIYLLDRNQQKVPIGIPGEVYVGGAGVAKGYLNREELTAEKFVPDIFHPQSRGRLYRSGDQAMYLANGDIEYLGRIEEQVKIRGVRIDLGEIETSLKQHPGIRQAVVVAREDPPNNKRLVAYFVPRTDQVPGSPELRNLLKRQFPDYMVPADYVALTELPVLPNGEIERKALPQPERVRAADGYTGPRDEFEKHLCESWAALLELERVDIRDNFFDLGGNSFLAEKVTSALRRELGIDLEIAMLSDHPTIEELSPVLEEKALTKLLARKNEAPSPERSVKAPLIAS